VCQRVFMCVFDSVCECVVHFLECVRVDHVCAFVVFAFVCMRV
jgi:hypothetical protein